jgi:hypothetical protein
VGLKEVVYELNGLSSLELAEVRDRVHEMIKERRDEDLVVRAMEALTSGDLLDRMVGPMADDIEMLRTAEGLELVFMVGRKGDEAWDGAHRVALRLPD